MIGSKSALKKHRKWHWDIEEKQRKRDEQMAKEKERLEKEQKEKKGKTLKKSTRKVKASQSSLAKLVVPSVIATVGFSTESGDSTEIEPMCE